MNTYTLYNSNGEITGYFSGDDDTLALNLGEGISYLVGEYSSLEYKIVNGAAVEKTPDEKLPPIDDVWAELRLNRDILLQETDWTQAVDSPLTSEEKTAWATYRQSLRDVPSNTTDPRNPSWPTKPT